MSERISPDFESRERLQTPEAQQTRPEHQAEKQPTHHEDTEAHHEAIETLKHKVETEAKSRKTVKLDETSEKQPHQHHLVTTELRADALRRSLQRARKHLNPADKALSKAIHQPVIDAVSKVGEKTIARPTGILAGSIVALIGTSYVLYMAKHYGFQYNYWIIVVLFVGGYAVGLIIEILWFAFRRLRSAK